MDFDNDIRPTEFTAAARRPVQGSQRRRRLALAILVAVVLAASGAVLSACDDGGAETTSEDTAEDAAETSGDTGSADSAEDADGTDAAIDTTADGAADGRDQDQISQAWSPPPVEGPPALEDLNPDPDVVEVEIVAAPARIELADGLELDMYAYNGMFPGPMLQAKVGDRVIVHFTNGLPEPTTIHWHGFRISDQMDGNPRIQNPVQPGASFTYDFVVPDAGTYWYHPHVRANEQIEKGLYAPIVIHDPADPDVFDVERVFVLDDILLDENDEMPAFLASHPEVMHGRSGNLLLTNGRADGGGMTASAQGDVERWRIINAANARTMSVGIGGVASARIIATDGGRTEQAHARSRVTLPVGQRYDFEVTMWEGGEASLTSYVLTRDADGNIVEEPFDVALVDVETTGTLPSTTWPSLEPAPARTVDREETIRFNGQQNADGELEWTLNGEAFPTEPLFTFVEGDTVRMTLINEAGPEHPFHLHGQFFRIVDDGGQGLFTEGLRDTVLVPGLTTVVIEAYLDNPGQWMAHCHILEHAELGMMSEIVVEPSP